MDWSVIQSQIAEKYPYWNNLRITYNGYNDTDGEPVPFFLQFYAFQIQQALEKNNSSNLCLVLPDRNQWSFWLSVLLALPLLQKHFDPSRADKYVYHNGQYCLYKSQHIVQIVEVDSNHIAFKVNRSKKNGRRVGQPPIKLTELRRNMIYFQPITGSHRLAEWDDIRSASTQKYLHPIDELLGIKSFNNAMCFNAGLLLLASKSDTDNSLSNYHINKMPPDLFMDWQYISSRGRHPTRSKIEKEFGPTVYLSSKLPVVGPLIESGGDSIKLAIIDSAKKIYMELGVVEDLMRRQIPVVCITDPRESDYFECLQQRQFEFLRTNMGDVYNSQFSTHIPSFHRIHSSIATYMAQKYEVVKCKNESLESIIFQYYDLKGMLQKSDRNHPLYDIIIKLSSLMRVVSQMVYVPPINSADNEVFQKLRDARKLLKDKAYLFSKELESEIKQLLDHIEGFIKDDNLIAEGGKFDYFQKKLSKLSNETICVITNSDSTALGTYWKALMKSRNIEFRTYHDFKKDANLSYSQLWVMGFNSKRKLQDIMASSRTTIILFLYQFEMKYFDSSVKRWWQKYFNSGQLSSITENEETRVPGAAHEEYSKKLSIATVIKREYQSRSPIPKSLQNADFYKIVFASGHHLICSATHKLYAVSEALAKRDFSDVLLYRPLQLEIGDFVMFRTTGTDIIREWVDQNLEKNGQKQLREIAESWKLPLFHYIEMRQNKGQKRSQIYRFFRSQGLKRSYVAFSSWLDPERIGPKNIEDLELILNITLIL